MEAIAKILQDGIQLIAGCISDVFFSLLDVVELDWHNRKQQLGQLFSHVLIAVAVLKRIYFEAENVVRRIIALHIAGGVVEHDLFDVLGYYQFFLRKNADQISDDFAVELGDEFEIGLFSLHEVLQL